MTGYESIFPFLEDSACGKRLAGLYRLLFDLPFQVEEVHFAADDSLLNWDACNFYLRGNSSIWITAHWDVVDPVFCANDNSASIINALMLKLKFPWLNIALLDREESNGAGCRELAEQMKRQADIEKIRVLNLELTGYGRIPVIGNQYSAIHQTAMEEIVGVLSILSPPSDTEHFLQYGIDSEVLFLVPDIGGTPDWEILKFCHTSQDTWDRIRTKDMRHLVENILPPFIFKLMERE